MSPIDPDSLAACQQRKAELDQAEATLSKARMAYETSIRRLYVEGGSAREIAALLGLSHQRVHQIANGGSQPMWKRILGLGRDAPRDCSFCGKGACEVRKLVGGVGVHICDGCISSARELAETDETTSSAFVRLDKGSPKRCSFCGLKRGGRAKFARGSHQICRGCLELADKIARDESSASSG